MRIAVCASFAFYEHVAAIEDQLIKLGHTPRIPETAKGMKARGTFDTDPLRDADGNLSDYEKKTTAIREHFAEIFEADAILVANDEKHGQQNYIGANVLMEMAVAFSQQKAIFLLHDIPDSSPFLDEIIGLNPVALKGNLGSITNA